MNANRGHLRPIALILAALLGLGACSATKTVLPPPPPINPSVFGAYLGPAGKGTERLAAWEEWSGVQGQYTLDFAAADTWSAISGPAWLLQPWRDAKRTLVLSVPMLPVAKKATPAPTPAPTPPSTTDDSAPDEITSVAHVITDTTAPDTDASLGQCARGDYDKHWSALGRALVAHDLANTHVRPGWEFNGDWYPWAASGQEHDFVGCFRRIVKVMRAVPEQHFQFIWNVALGPVTFPAEWAFPGETYVDIVGVNVYDVSSGPDTYPIPDRAGDAERDSRHRAAWQTMYEGDHGLRFWADFAHHRGLRLAIPEWALAALSNGRGGGDNPYFIDRMLDFIQDPANAVVFAMYFEVDSAVGGRHRVTDPATAFPTAADVLQRRLRGWPRPTSGPSSGSPGPPSGSSSGSSSGS
jgi:hypothetical protein